MLLLVLLLQPLQLLGGGVPFQTTAAYSGLYIPNTTFTAENYAGSWMLSRLKFFNAQSLFENVVHLEHISLYVTSNIIDPKCEALMTRDFLDFHVEHLSSTSNFVLGNDITNDLIEKMQHRVAALQKKALLAAYDGERPDPRRLHNTVVIIPFHLSRVQKREEGTIDTNEDATLRILFFKATFWATYHHFRHVVVGVSSKEHLRRVHSFGLPIFAVLDMSSDFYYQDVGILDGRTLPKFLLLRVINIMKVHPDWQQFRFVYYTEADQVLYARDLPYIYDAIDKNRPHHVVVPHRMQVI